MEIHMTAKYKLLKIFSAIAVLAILFSSIQPPSAKAQSGDGLKREFNAESGRVSFISPTSGRSLSAARALQTNVHPQDPAMALAEKYAPEFGLKDAGRSLTPMASDQNEDGRITARFQQNYENVPVMGGELIVNTNKYGDLYSISGEVSPALSISTQPVITSEQAQETALQALAKWYEKTPNDFVSTEPELWIYDESLLQPSTRPVELTWRMEVTSKDSGIPVRELVLVNTQRGGISLHFNQIDTAWASNSRAEHVSTPAVGSQQLMKNSFRTTVPLPAGIARPTPEKRSSQETPQLEPGFSSSFDATGVVWYVADTGSDLNSCASELTPCATINTAIEKAEIGDTIKVATGTYLGSGTEVVNIPKSITLSGGWDASFTSQIGTSIIDGQGARRGVYSAGDPVSIDSFTIQNGFHSTQGGGLYNSGTLILSKSVINGNVSQWMGGGIYNYGTMTINNTEIRANTIGQVGYSGGGGGGGIFNGSHTLTLNNSIVIGNMILGSFEGAGIHVFTTGTVNLNNSTIINNSGGSGIYISGGTVNINNGTISGNQFNGFTNWNGSITLSNTIVAENGGTSDCSSIGTVTSLGFNLIGNPTNCTFSPVTGDQVNVNPKLGILVGKPAYITLFPGSPAIDAGNPAIPGSGGAACLATDVRGVSRPVGARCDIGAYEYRATGVIPAYIIANSGTPQTISPGNAAPSNLITAVIDKNGDPVPGKTVTYTAPASGASAVFSNTGTNVSTAQTDASGIAVSSGFSTNMVAGRFNIQATVNGLADAANFKISNGIALVKTYTATNGDQLPGTLLCDQSSPNCTNGVNQHADTAHRYAMGTYDFYLDRHGRNSIDNAGMNIVSTVHYKSSYDNAYWSGTQMVYGDLYGYPMADDIVAHELTHGVTERESNLFYYYQSGAINESFSDLWGEYYDQTNGQGNDSVVAKWILGEEVTGYPIPAGLTVPAMRSMSNPPALKDPDRMSSIYYYKGEDDNGGVHWNSGINNKAVYLMVDGGIFNSRTVTALGWDKVSAIYYEVNTNLLTSGADYSDLYYALQQGCSNLVGQKGISAADCSEVKNALDAVEMNAQPSTNFNTDAPLCPTSTPVIAFADDFESGLSNWTLQNGTYTHWQSDSPYGQYAQSGQHFLYGDDYPQYGAATEASAILAPFIVPSNGYLWFAQAYDFETGYDLNDPTLRYYDGGVLEYSTNGGGTWVDAGPLFDTNGYNAKINNKMYNGRYINNLHGRSAFVGSSHGYISSRLNLSTLAGKSVSFRWRMGLDINGTSWGWWLDNVKVFNCSKPDTFADVASTHPYFTDIEILYANGLTGGCGTAPLKFCPDQIMNRAMASVFMVRGAYGAGFVPNPASLKFKDNWSGVLYARPWAEAMRELNLTSGCQASPLLYCPTKQLNREQAVIFGLKMKYGNDYMPPAATGTVFADMTNPDYYATDWAEKAYADGIITSCGTDTKTGKPKFCPNVLVTRGLGAYIIVRAKNLSMP
jgi:Zn-dependent metalloprotease